MEDQENASEIFHDFIYLSKWKQEIFVFIGEIFFYFFIIFFLIRGPIFMPW